MNNYFIITIGICFGGGIAILDNFYFIGTSFIFLSMGFLVLGLSSDNNKNKELMEEKNGSI